MTSDRRQAMSWSILASCALTHWINAIAILIMVGSGWRIYNNVPIFSLDRISPLGDARW